MVKMRFKTLLPWFLFSVCLMLFPNCNEKDKIVDSEEELFVRSQQVFIPASTLQIGLGDFDDDGDLDVFVANFVDGNNEIWFNEMRLI